MARREYVWTHDLAGEPNGVIGHGFFDLWHDERLDQSEQFGFEIAADNPKADLLAADVELLHRGRRFYITELEESRQGPRTTITVEADALWYRLGDLVYPGSFVLVAASPREGLELILRETGWTSGPSSSSAVSYSMEQQDKTRLALLRTWAKITMSSLVFNTAERTVSLVATRGRDLGLAFRYARNLTSVRRRQRPPALTVLYPYGADDLSIAGLNGGISYVEDFSYYTGQGLTLDEARALYTRSRVWSDSSFLIDSDLLAAAEARLALESQPVVSYELKVVDLSEILGNSEDVVVADRVRVFDPAFSEDVRATVSRVRRYRLEPWRNQIELSTILDPIRDAASSSRGARSAEWVQFVGPVGASYQIRNDGDYITNRIPLAFREGGRANFHLDLNAVGVGAGVMHVEVVDAANADASQFHELDVAYTDGVPVRALLQWATEDLNGAHDYRVRVTTVATGGPGGAKGVNIAADLTGEAAFWIMAQGAVQETPVSPNSARFEYTGAVQHFTIPDGVTEVEIETAGGGSGGDNPSSGCIVTHRRIVIPGTPYDVIVGGAGVDAASTGPAGWPNGGVGGESSGQPHGVGGGGSSDVRPADAAFTAAVVVAGAAGGMDDASKLGGNGGFMAGASATTGANPGHGATQFAGGTAGLGQDGSFGQGGRGDAGQSALAYPGGGGGGGWYGGEGAGPTAGPGTALSAGGGGGGSGWLAAGAFDITFTDGGNPAGDDGYIEFRWDDPLA